METARRSKREVGKSLLMIPDSYVVLDIETTGLDPSYNEIIEVACVKYRNGVEVDSYQTLIQPEPISLMEYVSEFITGLTGITNEMLNVAPKFENVQQELWDLVGTDIIVGHNVHFDINFLYDNFEKYGKILSNDMVDTMRIAKYYVLKELDHHRLDGLCSYYDIESDGHHRALNDCYMTNKLLNCLKRDIAEKGIILSNNHSSHGKIDVKKINTDVEIVNAENPLYLKNVCFTGKLETMDREEACKLAASFGAILQNGVTKKTDYLIVGNFDYTANIKGNKSGKLKKAESLILQGQNIIILSENVFLDVIEDSTRDNNDNNNSTPSGDIIADDKPVWWDDVDAILKKIENACGIPDGSLFIDPNYNKDGDLTSYSIAIFEPHYPPYKKESKTRNATVMLLKPTQQINKKDIYKTTLDAVKKYKSTSEAFGCCSKRDECSDRGECVHTNKLYSTSCWYRKNLETGNIFYGTKAKNGDRAQ